MIEPAAKPSPHSTHAMKTMIPITGQKVTPTRPINSPRLSDLSSEPFNRIIVSHKLLIVNGDVSPVTPLVLTVAEHGKVELSGSASRRYLHGEVRLILGWKTPLRS